MSKKILIIEDEDGILENIASILEFNNFIPILAKDGEEGLIKANLELPDLIICDIMMPKKDGYKVLEEIRKSTLLANTPFIFLTAKSDFPDKRKGMNTGADDYLTKPFKINELLEAINARLFRKSINNKAVEISIQMLEKKINNITSHELNTPLNAIIGFSEIIANYYDEIGKNETIEYSKLINEAGKKINKTFKKRILFTDLLNLEHNKFDYNKENILFDEMFVENIVMKFALEVQREDDIEIDVDNFNLFTSKELLSSAILEIFENAVNFSKKGTLIKIKSYNSENKHFIIVEDSGIGFNFTDNEQIQPFSKFSNHIITTEGSGLGLYLAKTIFVKLLNAEFKIESKINEFTRVTIIIPES
jgi:CheY-like chemotaxis protein